MKTKLALFSIMSCLLGACGVQPPMLKGNFAPVDIRQAALQESIGENVRWGGRVVAAREIDNRNCLEVSAMRLASSSLRPVGPNPYDLSFVAPRFLACQMKDVSDMRATVDSIVTFTGSVGSPELLNVQPGGCKHGSSYANTVHLNIGQNCVIALATLDISDTYLWPKRVSGSLPDGVFGTANMQNYLP